MRKNGGKDDKVRRFVDFLGGSGAGGLKAMLCHCILRSFGGKNRENLVEI